MTRFTRSVAGLLVSVFAVFALAACVASPPSEGTILDRTFTPAHEETYQVEVSTYDYGCHYVSVYSYEEDGYEQKYVCEFFQGYHGATEDRVRQIPDVWTILFEGLDSENELVTRTVSVSSSDYDKARPGYSILLKDETVFIQSR